MATATKTAAKKAAPKAKPAPAPEPEADANSREARKARDAELMGRVVEMRQNGAKWEEISAELDIKPGKAMFLEMQGNVSPKSKIGWKDDEELAAAVVKAREEDMLSWGIIAARTGASVGKIQRLFRDAVGERAFGHRIGKGGRFPAGMDRPEKDTNGSSKAKGTTKKAAAAKPAGTKAVPLSQIKDLAGMQAKLDGKTIKVYRDGKESKIGVKSVKEFKDGTVSFISTRGQTRHVKVAEITVSTSNA